MSSWGQGGSAPNWRRTRQQVLDRDRYECQVGLSGCTGVAIEVHHKVGIADRGLRRRDVSHNPDECVAICRVCHYQLTERQKRAGIQRANKLREQRKRLPVKPHPGELKR